MILPSWFRGIKAVFAALGGLIASAGAIVGILVAFGVIGGDGTIEARPGEIIVVPVENRISILEVVLVQGDRRFSVPVTRSDESHVTATIPDDVAPGEYNLELKTVSGETVPTTQMIEVIGQSTAELGPQGTITAAVEATIAALSPPPTPTRTPTPTPMATAAPTITLKSAAADCAPITFAEAVSDSIGPSSLDDDCYIFSGPVGAWINFRLGLPPAGPYIQPSMEVRNPDGTSLPTEARRWIESGASRWGEGCSGFTTISTFLQFGCELQIGGNHTILVIDVGGDNTGSYDLWVQSIKTPRGCTPISFGQPATNTIDISVEVGCQTFSVVAGNKVRVRATSSSITPVMWVNDPSGDQICGGVTSQLDCDIQLTGPHTIHITVARNGQTGDYDIALICLTRPCSGN